MDILITEACDGPALHRLTLQYQVVRDDSLWNDPNRLREQLRSARAIVLRNQTRLTADLLADATNLIAIGRVGVGLDNIDVRAASDQGVVVIAPLNANATSVAELTIGLLIALSRKIPSADRSTKAGGWDRKGNTGVELAGRTLALCGFGRIGRLVAARARAFDLQVLVFDPYVGPDAPGLRATGATLCGDLTEALKEADFVSIHTPLTSETRHLFGAKAFAVMKRGSFLINTARGGIVDEAALLGALQNGPLAGAALDVRESEPPAGSNPFAALDNVILTPHIGSFTHEAQMRTMEAVAADLDRVLRGEPAVNFVNFARPTPRTSGGRA
jgi:D-3-phosphoglycerate dehydrogenase